jgi:monofunctional glycosyltransferase
MAFVRYPEVMTSFAEKMRQIGDRLKSAGERARLKTASAADDAVKFWRKTRQRPVDWWTARRAASASPSAPVPSPAIDGAWAGDALDAPQPDTPPLPHPAPTGRLAVLRARHPRLAKALQIVAIVIGAYLVLPYPLVLVYSVFDPPVSALMLHNALAGRGIDYQWVDFDEISPNLARAAVISEDARFCRHWGVDWSAVGEVLEDFEDGDAVRGASTIPMQTAKNLFLWSEPASLRKVLEVPLAYFLSFVWSKQRVLEIYLNIAEWGPGIYGAEAAALYHFGKPASSLTRNEAALLVASLPSPLKRNAGRPSPQMQRLAARIQLRVNRESHDAACVFDH